MIPTLPVRNQGGEPLSVATVAVTRGERWPSARHRSVGPPPAGLIPLPAGCYDWLSTAGRCNLWRGDDGSYWAVTADVTAARQRRDTDDQPPEPEPDDRVVRLELLPGRVNAEGFPIALLGRVTDWAKRAHAPAPSLLWSDDLGHGLLYDGPGETCWIVGAAGGGKTWLALRAALEVIAQGRRVVWIEAQGDRNPLHDRCADLGCAEAIDGITHLTADRWLAAEPEDRSALIEWLGTGLLVIDSATNSGVGNTTESYAVWAGRYLPPGDFTGLVLSHPPKRLVDGQRLPMSKGPVEIGAGVAASLYIAGKCWERRGDIQRPGSVSVVVDKDRHGRLGSGVVAAVRGDYDADGHLVLAVTGPAGASTETAGTVENQVWAFVATSPGCSTRMIAPPGVSKAQAHKALKRLIDKGDIIRKPHGRGYAHHIADDAEPTLDEAQN